MKRNYLIAAILILGIAIIYAGVRYSSQAFAAESDGIETLPAERGSLVVTVRANGTVRSNQSAVQVWAIPGIVAEVPVNVGDPVKKGEILAELDPASLSSDVARGQAELVNARRALEDLLHSKLRSAEALKAVEDAQDALEDAQNPEKAQADALQAVSGAEAALEDAQLRYDILTTPVSPVAIEQAYSSVLLAENALNKLQQDIERIEKKLKRPESAYSFWESKDIYRQILEALELQLPRKQIAYEEALARYQRLKEPRNPNDTAVAEADLALAQAQFDQAQRQYERVKDGVSAGERAVLEAALADAEREYERWKDGPSQEDILTAEARITAIQALLDSVRLTAPFDGVVTQVFIHPGDLVDPGTQAFRIDDLSRLVVETLVSEIDVNKIQPGQNVMLTFDAIPPTLLEAGAEDAAGVQALSNTYMGTVVQVVNVGDVQEGVTYYKVRVELAAQDGLVRPGMTAEATFVINELQDVLLVPNRAIRFENGQRVVYVLREGELAPVEVELGAASDEYSQVLSGDIKAGDPIVVVFPENQ